MVVQDTVVVGRIERSGEVTPPEREENVVVVGERRLDSVTEQVTEGLRFLGEVRQEV